MSFLKMMLLTMEIGYVILKLPEGQTACVRYGGTKLLSYTYDAWGNCAGTGMPIPIPVA
jgi:hypothetical protein